MVDRNFLVCLIAFGLMQLEVPITLKWLADHLHFLLDPVGGDPNVFSRATDLSAGSGLSLSLSLSLAISSARYQRQGSSRPFKVRQVESRAR